MTPQDTFCWNGWGRFCLVLCLITTLLAGCGTPVGVHHLELHEANSKLSENVLSDESLSSPTQQILNRCGLAEKFLKDPAGAIQTLRTGISTVNRSDRFFALAELAFLYATKEGDHAYYLAAAVYAYAFLFPQESSAHPTSFDPRLVTAVNIYNQGLVLGLTNKVSGKIDIKSDTYRLPFGDIAIRLNPEELHWGPFTMVDFIAAAQLEARGIRNDYRWPGIGAAMVASLKHNPGEKEQNFSLVPAVLKMAVTAVLRFENIEEELASGKMQGTMALYTTQENSTIAINGHPVPLEFRPTAALAYTLEGSQVYDLELKGLLSGDLKLFKQASRFKDNVFLMTPYIPGRIPLVLVHGTASSPARWAELINEIINDRELQQRYQIWLFTYNTGNPVLYSGGLLAQGLKNIVKELDPEGKDEALHKMVIIGHSQGGLLTKLTAIESGDRFWDNLFAVPLDQLDTTPETREALRRSLFFQPLPFVNHVVFISTPHRGSFLAKNWVSNLLQRVISLPFTLLSPLQEIFQKSPSALKVGGMKDGVPRSTDNMNPESKFIKNFAAIPLSPGIKAHSIIAVANPEDPQEEWDDGVVTFKSAHVEGVVSERIVPSGHSAQDNPEAIEEVRRILLENLQ